MKKNLILLFASGFGLGLIPKAPGTFGTLLGLILAAIFPNNIYLLVGIGVIGVWLSHEAEKVLEEHDSPKIVIDEVAGFLIAAYNWHGFYLIMAFILFRILDVFKPDPIRQLQKLPGGIGIMADDLAAGLLTNLAIRLATRIFPF
ncbi:MAG: phosphatidylglycerophosphatase A family protein [Eubacteriales bacterium]